MELNEKGVNTLLVKDINTRIVMLELKRQKNATIKELSVLCDLTVVTVKTILEDMIKAGRAFKGELVPSKGGRPSQSYHFNENYSLGLSLFIREIDGEDSVCLRVFDLFGKIKEAEDYKMGMVTLENIEELIEKSIRRFSQIGAISIGIPGIEYEGEIVSLDYEDFIGTPIVSRLEKKFKLPVIIENDVNAAVLGRARISEDIGTEIYIYFPRKYKPGSGIRVNGKILKGKRHFAGEIGWLPLNIEWGAALADSIEGFTDAASRVIISMISVLDPDSVIIHGEYISEEHIKKIRQKCSAGLPDRMTANISCAEDFSLDYENGLIDLTLSTLESEEKLWQHFY
ncbi:MAG: ROK family protein [Spirochaetales bacterium]|nr:ROK family protein [Spirochaetales bacterium]